MTGGTTLDVRGRTCPMPILLLTRAVRELALGERLEVLADDAQFPGDVRAWCDYSGNKLLELESPSQRDRWAAYRAHVA